jgi:hypothetical protein
VTVLTLAPLAAGTITAAAAISRGEQPRLRIAFASVTAAVMLSLIGRLALGPARLFAGLIIIGTMLGPGYDLLAALSRLVTN